jgi:ribose transport system substrate-binding protein
VVKAFSFVLFLIGATIAAGCDGKTEKSNQPARDSSSNNAGVIGVSLLTLENPFFRVIGDNITSEGSKEGYETVVVSADKDPAKQSNQVKDFIVKKVAAIVLSPCESRAIVPVIQEANAAGIPVFTVDIPCREPGVKIVSQIATDNLGGGKEAARAMIEALGPAGGKVAILHHKQAESCRLRVQGFTEVVNDHNAKGPGRIEVVAELEGGGLKDEAYRAAQDVLQSHSDIRGIFAINDPTALGARAALEKASKADQVKIVGFDGQLEGKQAIKEGKIWADPIQFPDRMGAEIVKAIVMHSKGRDVPPEILIPTRLYRKADAEKDPQLSR